MLKTTASLTELVEDFRPSALLFDIDGVLVEVRGSYLKAIELASARALARSGRPPVPDAPAFVARLKRIPGWNNDWDCTHALVRLGLLADDAGEFGRRFDELEAARLAPAALEAESPPPGYDRDRQWLDFQGYYLGREKLRALYGREAEFDHPAPLWRDEPVLARGGTLRALAARFRIGAYTGRSGAEAALAFERIGFAPEATIADDGVWRKPDPGGLHTLREKFGAARAIYFGDSVDDARAAAAARPAGAFRFVAIGADLPGMALRIEPGELDAALRGLLAG